MYVVSACLLGANCKYDGGNNENEAVKEFCNGHKVVTVCPETEGGLEAPRPPAEQVPCDEAAEPCGEQMACDEQAESCEEQMACDEQAESCEEGKNPEAVENSEAAESPEAADDQDVVKVVDKEGKDLTEAFNEGARKCLSKVIVAEIMGEECELAILKENRPSCGSCRIYDGTFTGTLTDGDGVFTKLIKKRGIKVVTEKDIEKLSAK